MYKDVYVNVLGRYCHSFFFPQKLSSEKTLPCFLFRVAQAPEFEETPHNEETVDGRIVNMTCRVAGSPRPQIKWIHNGVELTGGRYTTKPNGDLEIR